MGCGDSRSQNTILRITNLRSQDLLVSSRIVRTCTFLDNKEVELATETPYKWQIEIDKVTPGTNDDKKIVIYPADTDNYETSYEFLVEFEAQALVPLLGLNTTSYDASWNVTCIVCISLIPLYSVSNLSALASPSTNA